MATLPTFGLWYDFRNPAPWRRPFGRMYADYLDQIANAEALGFGSVWLTEHHFLDDGYLPSPLIMASAIGQRTRRMRIGTDLMVLPLHDPVRIAEDAAVLSLVTGGRFDLGVGLGYKEAEFAQFGRSIKHRPSLIEESVEILRRAWAGETIDVQGKRFTINNHAITPHPETVPQILLGGIAPPAIERAARIADGFLPSGENGIDHYLQCVADLGRDPAEARIMHGSWAIIAPDPEAEAERIGPHILYQINQYRQWGAWGPPENSPPFATAREAIEGSLYQLWDAEAAVTHLQRLIDRYPQIRDIHFWAQLPGESVESGQRRLDYIATSVLPRLRPTAARP